MVDHTGELVDEMRKPFLKRSRREETGLMDGTRPKTK